MRSFTLTALCVLFFSCSPAVRLAPAPDAKIPSGIPLAALGSKSGVTILLEPEIWTGYPAIGEQVTAIRTTITNQTEEPLRIRYDLFQLKIGRKKLFAQSPYQIHGMIRVPYRAAHFLQDTVFHYRDSRPDPCCEILERYLSRTDTINPDPGGMPDVWVQLPTSEMIDLVLPDGVLPAGQQVSGYLYFEKITSGPSDVTFTAQIAQSINGALVTTVEIPLRLIQD